MGEKFEVTEEFTKAVTDVVKAVMEEKETAAEKKKRLEEEEAARQAEAAKVEEAKKVLTVAEKGEKAAQEEERFSTVTKSIEKLTEAVQDVSKKYDELSTRLVTTPGAGEDDGNQAEKSDEPKVDNKKKSVFAGLLTAAA